MGLVAWAAGLGALGVYLAPDGRTGALLVASAGGLVAAAAGAWLLLRHPWVLAFATLACIPIRIPFDIGDETANLLFPMYAVIGALALALAWQLLRGDDRARELGPLAWPLAAVVGWTGLALLWTDDLRQGAIFLAAFVLPFGLLAVGFARLPFSRRALLGLFAALVATALAYAGVGLYQWATREVFWNPKLRVDNAYAPFFRVNSVFWDPSIYGRYLVVAILATLALVLLGLRNRLLAAGIVAIVAIWVGLLFSFSQSSFAALIAGTLAAAALIWRWRAAAALAVLAVVLVSAGFATPQVRHELLQESRQGLNSVTSDRAGLVGNGLRIAVDHPVLGVGTGSFKRAYAEKTGPQGGGAEEGRVALDPGDRGRRDGRAGARAALLARIRRAGDGLSQPRQVGCGTRGTRRGAYAWRDRRAQPLLQRALRGSDHVGAARPDRARQHLPPAGARARVIETWKRVLVLAPHTDDGEFGCGGTMARLVEAGVEVHYHAFSIATRSLPDGFAPDTLAREVREATGELGIPEGQLRVHDFDVRTFPERRQDILELLVGLWEELKPDAVFQPSHHDVHQDHQTIAQEGLRAFKRTTVLGYEIPWNNFDFSYGAYVALEQRHLERKVAALARYASQQHRRYANPEYVWNLARVHGINVNREYAECFQVYRIVA